MATPQKTAARPSAPAKTAAKPTPPTQAAKPQTAPQGAKPAATAAKPAAPQGQQRAPEPRPDPKPAASTAVVERDSTAVATQANVPDYIKGSAGRGSENVEMADMVIPRIELVQALSKCLEEGSAEYIEGAKAGMFYNSVTRQLYGYSVTVCPAFFKKQYLAWRDRKKGGGFGGAFDSAQECHERISQEDNADEWEAVETAQQILLVVDTDTYDTSEAVLSCARTKVKTSRQWNSLIRVNGFDRFSRIYELFGVDETNSQNQTYKNIAVRYVDFAPMAVFKAAEALYNSIAEGSRAVKIDDNYDEGVIDGDAQPAETGADTGAQAEY